MLDVRVMDAMNGGDPLYMFWYVPERQSIAGLIADPVNSTSSIRAIVPPYDVLPNTVLKQIFQVPLSVYVPRLLAVYTTTDGAMR